MNRLDKLVLTVPDGGSLTVYSPEFSSERCIGLRLWSQVQARIAGSVIVSLEIKNPLTTEGWLPFPLAAFASQITIAPFYLTIYPGIAVAANVSVNDVISGGLRVKAVFTGASGMRLQVFAQFLE